MESLCLSGSRAAHGHQARCDPLYRQTENIAYKALRAGIFAYQRVTQSSPDLEASPSRYKPAGVHRV